MSKASNTLNISNMFQHIYPCCAVSVRSMTGTMLQGSATSCQGSSWHGEAIVQDMNPVSKRSMRSSTSPTRNKLASVSPSISENLVCHIYRITFLSCVDILWACMNILYIYVYIHISYYYNNIHASAHYRCICMNCFRTLANSNNFLWCFLLSVNSSRRQLYMFFRFRCC